jgi:hypothetical protein
MPELPVQVGRAPSFLPSFLPPAPHSPPDPPPAPPPTGVPKHHINNANLMRNGADFAVYLNTAQEYDGSDSGARPDEAVSWGKIRPEARPVKVTGDATILFPLLVSQTFAKAWWARRGEGAAAADGQQPQQEQQQPQQREQQQPEQHQGEAKEAAVQAPQ